MRCDIKRYWTRSVARSSPFVYDSDVALSVAHVDGAYPIKLSYRNHVPYNLDALAQIRERYNVDVLVQDYTELMDPIKVKKTPRTI